MRGRLITGLISILLVIFIIIGPIYIAEKFETLETSNNTIIPYESLIEISSNETEYEPYFNHGLDNVYWSTASGNKTAGFYQTSSNADNLTTSWDLLDDWDYSYTVDTGLTGYLGFRMQVNGQEILDNGINTIHIKTNISQKHHIQYCKFTAGGSTEAVAIPSEWLTQSSGKRDFVTTMTQTNLNNIATIYTTNGNFLRWDVFIHIDEAYHGEILAHSILLSPEYYEETTTTYDNQTVTSYKPYIQKITTKDIHSFMMGLGAVLICGIGLITSPLPVGRAINGLLPINSISQTKPKKRRRKY